MAKRRLSTQQLTRIKRAQQQHLEPETLDQSGQTGLVITQYGQTADVLPESGQEIIRCFLRQNIGSVAAGDRIVFQDNGEAEPVIVARQARHNELTRPDRFGKLKTVAANIDVLFVVFASQPEPQAGLIDRYLVAAELQQIQPVLVFNKTDLLSTDERETYLTLFSYYQSLGYPLILSCAHANNSPNDNGINELQQQFAHKSAVFVGQSGVGKSSLINRFLNQPRAKTGQISEKQKGRHTTTAATLYQCRNQGYVIDSPGIAEFGLWHLDPARLILGFIEFQPFLGQCQFRNCQHLNETGCALTAAVEQGKIHPQRLANYHHILQSIRDTVKRPKT